MIRRMIVLATALAIAASVEAGEAAGGPAQVPLLRYSFYLGLAGDRIIHTDAAGYELYDVNPESILAVDYHPAEWLGFHLGLTLESVHGLDAGEDRYFRDLGLYVDTLNVSVEQDGFTAVAGKFTPGFGTAWDITPGIYSSEFVEDYEFSEMIGAGAGYSFDMGAAGTVTAGASLFFVDTTVLSDSLFTRRGRTLRSDGGAGNTGRLDNVAVTLDGSDIDMLPGFAWHLGYAHLSAGEGDEASVNGWVAGVQHETELSGGANLALNGEIAYLDAGAATGSSVYYTAGAGLTQGPWHGELAGTFRQVAEYGQEYDDLLLQASAGYRFDNGVDLAAGYAFRSDTGTDSHRVGVRLTWSFEHEIAR